MLRTMTTILLAILTARSGQAISCTATTSAVAFGSYSPVSTLPADSLGTVTVSCTTLIALFAGFTVALSPGAASSYSPRKMTGGTNGLNYNLYRDLSRSQVWGDGTNGTSIQSYSALISLLGVVVPYVVYGRIPARQAVRGGSYGDSIVVSITF